MKRIKYPRTYHLPFTGTKHADDKVLQDFSSLNGHEVIVTLKMDGENTTYYSDGYYHARSIDSRSNVSRDYAKQKLAAIQYMLPEGYRICCENLYAIHSIAYPDDYLEDYLYLLSIWDKDNICLSWDDTEYFARMLSIPQPKVLYRGEFNLIALEKLSKTIDTETEEGFVVRRTSEISYEEFPTHVAKWVRPFHVQNDSEHWIKNIKKNGEILKK